MKYKNTCRATLIERINRFEADVMISKEVHRVHVKNTGRCREILVPGCDVVLSKSDNPNRKTEYDLIAAYKKDFGFINIDSQAPNQVVKEWLMTKDYSFVKPEYTYGASRIDFYMERNDEKYLIEVKGCTLEIDGMGYFPDAPTERGVKHLRELAKATEAGYKCILAFVIQMEGINEVKPCGWIHPEFKIALDEAKNAGVEILFLCCRVSEDELYIV